MTEAEIQEDILAYLDAQDICHWRMETTGIPIVTKSGKLILTKNVQRRGMADILVIFQSKPVWIEVKSPTGTQSLDQIKFQEKVSREGTVYSIARSVDDVIELLDFLREEGG